MKGIVLTSTGESLATPSQAELVNLFNCSPKVGLNFGKIFDFDAGDHNGMPAGKLRDDEGADSPPPSPSSRKTKEKERMKEMDEPTESSSSTSNSCGLSTATTSQVSAAAPPTRIRRPSIRSSTRPTHNRAGTLPTSASDPYFPTTISSSSEQPKPLPHPHLRPSKSNSHLASNPAIRATTMPARPPSQGHHRAPPEYDFADEENLPSPFLKKNDKNSQPKTAGTVGPITNLTSIAPGPSTATSTSSVPTASRGKRRPSSGLLLRAVAAANNVERRGTLSSRSTTASPVLDNGNPPIESIPAVDAGMTTDNHNGGGIPRSSLANARKASEEARKALLRV